MPIPTAHYEIKKLVETAENLADAIGPLKEAATYACQRGNKLTQVERNGAADALYTQADNLLTDAVTLAGEVGGDVEDNWLPMISDASDRLTEAAS